MIEECLVVEFGVQGDGCPLADASRETGATIEATPPLLRSDGNALLRFSTGGEADVGAVLDRDDRVRYLHAATSDGRSDFRCLSKEPCVVHDLIDVGFMAESLRYRDGDERYTGAVVGHDVLQGVLEAVGETVGVTLERVYPLRADDESSLAQRWECTPAQEAALRTAFEMGYFEVPRTADASEVAAALGISKTAFLERLHRGQAALFGQLFA